MSAPSSLVPFTFDGSLVEGHAGEPVAVALYRAGYTELSRSPKFHRPRGAACMRGGCEGCLVRIDGEANVHGCLHPVSMGLVVETQNRLPGPIDLRRGADFAFPNGMNHHELLLGVPILSDVVGVVARQMAGLGRLPDALAESAATVQLGGAPALDAYQAVTEERVDVLVVGTGHSGQLAAEVAHEAGLSVLLVDDAPALGGNRRALGTPVDGVAFPGEVRLGTTLAGLFAGRALLSTRATAQQPVPVARLVAARHVVLAPGVHDAPIPCGNEDVPGVYSARAAGILATAGAVDARTVAVVVAPRGASKIGRSVADRLNAKLFEEPVLEVRGFSRTEGVRLASGDIPANLLVVDVPGAPAHELLAQAGFPLEYRGPAGLGYAPVNGASGVARHRADGVNYLAIGGVLGLTEPRPDADVRTALRAIFTELIVDEEAEEHKAAEHRDHVEDTQK